MLGAAGRAWVPGVLHSHHCKYRNTHRRGNGTEIPPAEMYINTKHQQRLFVLHKQLLCSRTVPFFGCVYHRFFHLELQQITANGFSEVKKEANKFLRRFALLRFSTQHNPRISGSHRGWGCSGAPLPLHPSHRVSRSELRRRGTSAPCRAGQRRSGAGPGRAGSAALSSAGRLWGRGLTELHVSPGGALRVGQPPTPAPTDPLQKTPAHLQQQLFLSPPARDYLTDPPGSPPTSRRWAPKGCGLCAPRGRDSPPLGVQVSAARNRGGRSRDGTARRPAGRAAAYRGDRGQEHPQSLAVCSLLISVSLLVPKWPNMSRDAIT